MLRRDSNPVQLGSIELFCKAAELSGFSAAAEALGVTPAAVSRSIGRLEKRLGVKLFARTTRQIKLTDDGRLYFAQCSQALAQIREAERALSGQQRSPSGVLRISAPTTYAHYRLLPLLPQFAARYPALKIDLSISNRNVDFVDEGFDVAIRMGSLDDSGLIARKLEDATLGLFAAPSYLRARGVPQDLSELANHACIQFILPSTGRAIPWRVKLDGREQDHTISGAISIREDVLACVSYAQAGGGLCQIYHFIAQPAVQRGELREVLPQLAGCTRPFSIVYPQNRHLTARVRAFVDFMVDQTRGLSRAGSAA